MNGAEIFFLIAGVQMVVLLGLVVILSVELYIVSLTFKHLEGSRIRVVNMIALLAPLLHEPPPPSAKQDDSPRQ